MVEITANNLPRWKAYLAYALIFVAVRCIDRVASMGFKLKSKPT